MSSAGSRTPPAPTNRDSTSLRLAPLRRVLSHSSPCIAPQAPRSCIRLHDCAGAVAAQLNGFFNELGVLNHLVLATPLMGDHDSDRTQTEHFVRPPIVSLDRF